MGNRSISVQGTGNDSNAWFYDDWRPEPNQTYLIRYRLRIAPNSTGGTPIAGFTTANHDAWRIPRDDGWHTVTILCRTPLQKESHLRFGQWNLRGKVQYDDIEVYSAVPVHRRVEGFELGEGESVNQTTYRFSTLSMRMPTNASRPLVAHTATFNTDRWVFGEPLGAGEPPSGDWVVYRHSVGIPFRSASLRVRVGYRDGGALVVELSKDGTNWREAGRFERLGEHTVEVPQDLLPAETLWVRVWATGVWQVSQYEFTATLTRPVPSVQGATWYFLQKASNPDLAILPMALEGSHLRVQLRNRGTRARQVRLQLTASSPDSRQESLVRQQVRLASDEIREIRLPLPNLAQRTFTLNIEAREGRTMLSEYQAEINRPWIEVGGFGYALARSDALQLWWSEATYKVGQTVPVPERTRPIRIESACNEYEPFQLVLSPQKPLKRLTLRLSEFTSGRGSAGRPVWDEVARVDYVPVTIPTDGWGAPGSYPDPLIPLYRRARWTAEGEQPQEVQIVLTDLRANQNQPLWITVFVPKDTPKGVYRATLQIVEAIDENGNSVPVPRAPVRVELRVFGFTLPDVMPLRTAFGVNIDNDWHRLRTPEQFQQVWDSYMQICRRYRISPYTPHAYAPIRWEAIEQDGALQFRYDFSEFDKAMTRYLDEFGFSGFNLVILPERLAGHEQFTPEWTQLYKQLMAPILEHLRQKGWLSKAYCYWIDEPHTPQQYELTKRGMEALKQGAPGVRRLLTNYIEKFPSPTFYDLVDLWVPIMNQYDEGNARQRQALGEEVWWYVCTGPKEPYPNNFIDHPAITHRIRYWMMARWGLDGDLYWSITYMRGQNWAIRNPYEDAQSQAPEGNYWGNGDGRMLYPPVRQPLPEDAEPVLDAPFPSLRLALLSEGIEDHCYLWLLSQLLQQARQTPNPNETLRRAIQQGESALESAFGLFPSMTEYTTDPQRLMQARQRVAEAIEQLREILEIILPSEKSLG